jgi:DHA1 family multidrug resistance protein-like MFS transporter
MGMTSSRNIHILAFCMLVVMLGYGMVMPIIPFYIERFGAGGQEMGWLIASYSLMQMLCAPLWGALSDSIGRKPVIALGMLGYALTLLLFGLSTRFWMLFLARTLSGILSSATMPTSMAYIGDQSSQDERSTGMGKLGAAMGFGIIAGPLIGGQLSFRLLALPFFTGAALALSACLLVLIFLPETAQAQNRPHKKVSANLISILQTTSNPARKLLGLIFIISIGLANFQGIIGLFAIDRFNTNTQQVGLMWAMIGAMLIIGQGLLIGPFINRLGEPRLILFGMAGGMLGFIGIALAGGYTAFLSAIGLLTLAIALAGPTLNSHLSRFGGEQQGTLMGLNSAASSLGRVVGPLLAGYLYDLNMAYPFWSGLAIMGVGALMASRIPQDNSETDTLTSLTKPSDRY